MKWNKKAIIIIVPIVLFLLIMGVIDQYQSNKRKDFLGEISRKQRSNDIRGEIKACDAAINEFPDDSRFYRSRAEAKIEMSDLTGAIADYTECIRCDKSSSWYDERAKLQMELNNYNEAIADYSKAIELSPKSYNSYANRGNAKNRLHDYTGAMGDLNIALEINPKNDEAYMHRGESKYFLGDKNGANLDWSKAGELGNKRAYDIMRAFSE